MGTLPELGRHTDLPLMCTTMKYRMVWVIGSFKWYPSLDDPAPLHRHVHELPDDDIVGEDAEDGEDGGGLLTGIATPAGPDIRKRSPSPT